MPMEKAIVKEYIKTRASGSKVSTFQINLKKAMDFKGDEKVIVISQAEWDLYLADIEDLKDLELYHQKIIKLYKKCDVLESVHDDLIVSQDKLKNVLARYDNVVNELDGLKVLHEELSKKYVDIEAENNHYVALFEKKEKQIQTMESTIEELHNRGLGSYLMNAIKNPLKRLDKGKD